jgi:hypothetical protein
MTATSESGHRKAATTATSTTPRQTGNSKPATPRQAEETVPSVRVTRATSDLSLARLSVSARGRLLPTALYRKAHHASGPDQSRHGRSRPATSPARHPGRDRICAVRDQSCIRPQTRQRVHGRLRICGSPPTVPCCCFPEASVAGNSKRAHAVRRNADYRATFGPLNLPRMTNQSEQHPI